MAAFVRSLKNDRHRIDTELTQPELAAIGYVTVLWAELEHILLYETVKLAGQAPPPQDALSLSFKKRLRAWRSLIKTNVNDKKRRTMMLKTANNIGEIERSRHRITHGLWDWLETDAASLRASSFRSPHDFAENFDFHKVIKIAHKIGEVSFRLRFPGGWDDAEHSVIEDHLRRGISVSRRFLLETMGKDPANPHLPLTNPEGHTTPRQPSRAPRGNADLPFPEEPAPSRRRRRPVSRNPSS
jgi:hypothetical protein